VSSRQLLPCDYFRVARDPGAIPRTASNRFVEEVTSTHQCELFTHGDGPADRDLVGKRWDPDQRAKNTLTGAES
jgi:hypothetical protein